MSRDVLASTVISSSPHLPYVKVRARRHSSYVLPVTCSVLASCGSSTRRLAVCAGGAGVGIQTACGKSFSRFDEGGARGFPRTADLTLLHSYLSALSGSIRMARKAGRQVATSGTPQRSRAIAAKVRGSPAKGRSNRTRGNAQGSGSRRMRAAEIVTFSIKSFDAPPFEVSTPTLEGQAFSR